MLITYSWPYKNIEDLASATFRADDSEAIPSKGDFVDLAFTTTSGEKVRKSGWVSSRTWTYRQGDESEVRIFLGETDGDSL